MTVENNSLMNMLVKDDGSPKKGRVSFETAMHKLGFESVFDIVRLSQPEFASRLARLSDANAEVAYDNAKAYATLLARLYREHTTSSGAIQQLAQRTGVRSLASRGPTYANLFKENWGVFCKVGAIAAVDSPVAYLAELHRFIHDLESTRDKPEDPIDPQRILLDKRRPDLKDLLITQESTFTPRPMLEIVNDTLSRNLRTYLDTLPADKPKTIHQVLTERRFPFELPYNFYHQQCQLGLADRKPRLGELNYRVSLLLPIAQDPEKNNAYGQVQKPVLQAQQLLSGLSPQLQALLIEPSVFSNFYLNRNNLINGWKSAGNTHLSPHAALGTYYLLPSAQKDITSVTPPAETPISNHVGDNLASVIFSKTDTEKQTVELVFNTTIPNHTGRWRLNYFYKASADTTLSSIKAKERPEPPTDGYTATFDLITATGAVDKPVIKLARQRFTLTLDEKYHLTVPEKAFFKRSYGVDVLDDELSHLSDLDRFKQQTGLNTDQVEMLLSQHSYAVRLSPNCPSLNPQSAGVVVPGITGKVLPFPRASHYGACYVNGTGTGGDLYDIELPSPESIIRDQFDNSMGLEQEQIGQANIWRLTKLSLNRIDRLQRMVRLQRYTGIPFTDLDTLVICAMRAEGEDNLGMELNNNTLRALGVYRHLNQRYGIAPQEFAALLHYLTPYACGKDAVPLFDWVFNQVQLFDTPLILDQAIIKLDDASPATQKTLLQLCAGLGLQPTEDSLLLIAKQTQTHVGPLKRDLPTVSSLYRQVRIAQLFGYSVADLLALAGLLGGHRYKRALASGRLSLQTGTQAADILDVLMQLDWAVDWLKDSQQTVAQLQRRLGPNVPLAAAEESEGSQTIQAYEYPPLPDDRLKRLDKLHDDTRLSCVTEAQVAALGLPARDNAPPQVEIKWFELLKKYRLLDNDGLLEGLDADLTLIDEPLTWLGAGVERLLNTLMLPEEVRAACTEKLMRLLVEAHDKQTQLLEELFKETAELPVERTVAVIHLAHASVYSILLTALDDGEEPWDNTALIEYFQRVSQHAEIVVQLRLSDSALRLFLVNPDWLGAVQYAPTNSEPSLAELYLFERFSHWFHSQSQSEDALLSYFSLANPGKAKLKNKALRQIANETANAALARLLDWSVDEVATLTCTLTETRACSMAQVDWVRRCQATCQASGLSAGVLLKATDLNDETTPAALNAWKAVGDAVMAANPAADSSLASV